MTCETFRAFNESLEVIIDSTRGERASCAKHIKHCPACRAWCDSMPAFDVPPETIYRLRGIQALDMQDPEFIEVTES